jgi:hypothetical protein
MFAAPLVLFHKSSGIHDDSQPPAGHGGVCVCVCTRRESEREERGVVSIIMKTRPLKALAVAVDAACAGQAIGEKHTNGQPLPAKPLRNGVWSR